MYLEISNPMDYHVALYIRLSKEDENEGPSESVNNQKSLLDDFVKKHRLSVYDTYIDDGWSGTNFDRPDFQRMIGDIEAKKVNMVITKDLSRLGRDYIMTGHYMERYFPEKRVRYISLLDGIDTGVESSANDITPFRAIMNDMYAKDISKKIKSVKRDKQRKGQFVGGKPVYGYKMHPTEKNKIVIDEEVAPIVRRIFHMALEGMSCRQIATQLNEEGVPTPATYAGLPVANPGPYTGLWSSERISDMLQNETYIGNMVQGRTVKISYKSKKCLKQDRENWVVVEGTHEAYLDPSQLQPIAITAVEEVRKAESHDSEIQSLHSKIDGLTANLDKMYMDRLTGLLAESDFERIYQRIKMERNSLEEKLKDLEVQKESPVSTEDRARELVQRFITSAYASRELLVSLIERVELTEDKQIIVKFRFRELEAIS